MSPALAAGLWLGLEFGATYSPEAAAAAGVGLAAFLGALGIAWSQLPGSPAVVTASDSGTLKGVTRVFADRVHEWADLSAMARRARLGGEVRLVVFIYGMPGVGKSEFAQYAAHRLVADFTRYARRRHLELMARQVELHGLEGVGRTDPCDALRAQLDLGGSDPRRATMNLDELSAEWRKYLQGKLLVLVLDNADNEGQVLPFLPGGSPYIILITGRRSLQGLIASGVTPYRLDVLDADGAERMVANILANPVGSGDQEAAGRIVELCGYQPLAIKLAVQPLAGRPGMSLANRQAQLAESSNRLLAVDEYATRGNESPGGVAQAFDLSYTHLSAPARLLLMRMAVAPVLALGTTAAAAVAGLPAGLVAASLRELEQDSLLVVDDAGERYEMHDLIRYYGQSIAEREDSAVQSEAAVSKLLAYYCDAAAQADTLLTRQPAPVTIEQRVPPVRQDFADRSSVVKWCRAELPNLLLCADYSVVQAENKGSRDGHAWVVLLASAMAGILRNEGWWRRSIELQTQAIKSAEALDMPIGVANALSERGMLHRLTAELSAAVADLDQAIVVYRQAGGPGGRAGEARSLNTYGVVLDQLGQPDEAERRFGEALDIYRQAGDSLGVANVLHDKGMAAFFRGTNPEAIALLEQALGLYRKVDQPLGMAHAHGSLGRALQRAGSDADAARNLESARVLYQDLGNRLGEINVLVRLGAVLRLQDPERAAEVLIDAIRLSGDIGNQLALVEALDELGEVYLTAGDIKAARDAWARALRLARQHGIAREAAKLAGRGGR